MFCCKRVRLRRWQAPWLWEKPQCFNFLTKDKTFLHPFTPMVYFLLIVKSATRPLLGIESKWTTCTYCPTADWRFSLQSGWDKFKHLCSGQISVIWSRQNKLSKVCILVRIWFPNVSSQYDALWLPLIAGLTSQLKLTTHTHTHKSTNTEVALVVTCLSSQFDKKQSSILCPSESVYGWSGKG